LVAGTDTYVEDALQLATTGTFAVDDSDGRAAGSTDDGETFTLQAADGGGFVLYSLQLGNTGANSKAVTFHATSLNGNVTQIAITADPNAEANAHESPIRLDAPLDIDSPRGASLRGHEARTCPPAQRKRMASPTTGSWSP